MGGWESTFQWCCVQVVEYTRVREVYPCPRPPSAEPHGGANKASAPPLVGETVEKEVPAGHRSSSVTLSSDNGSPPQQHDSALCVCVFTNAHSVEEEEKDEKEVLEGGVRGSLVCFFFKLLLQHGLLFHRFLCGPEGERTLSHCRRSSSVSSHQRHAHLLVSVSSGTEPGCSTSTLREAMALTVSASSFSDWP